VLGSSLLAVAAGNGDIGAIDLLLAHGALPDQPRDANGGTPLLTAAGLARFEAAAHLMALGADARASTDQGSTLLHALAMAPQPVQPGDGAAQTRMLDLAAEAIRRGARVNAQIEGPGSTALMFAALNGNQALAALLLAQGADASLRNARGQTAQDFAQRKGHADLAQLLAASAPGRGDRPMQETR
jgi:ankyrin repeat protein